MESLLTNAEFELGYTLQEEQNDDNSYDDAGLDQEGCVLHLELDNV